MRTLAANEDRLAKSLLAVLVVLGAGLRILLMKAQSPGFISINDSAVYLIAAHVNVFVLATDGQGNPWPAGYPAFLGLIYALGKQLSLVMVVQHCLGVGTALLWFATVRRVASPLWGLLPAAVILLAGPQLFLEHAPMTESLFGFLIAVLSYSAVRAMGQRPMIWAALTGGAAAAAACVRVAGVLLIAVVGIWLLACVPGDLVSRLRAVSAAALATALVLGFYLVEMKRETGFGGPMLTRGGTWSAPPSPAGERSYLERFTGDLPRFWKSDNRGSAGGYNYDGLVEIMSGPITMNYPFRYPYFTRGSRTSRVVTWYATATARVSDGPRSFMLGYERRTRVEGTPWALLLLFALVGVPLARGRQLATGCLALGVAAVTVLTPVVYLYFDARYAVPGYGPLAGAAAIGGFSAWASVRHRSRAPTRQSSAKEARAHA
jgi:hypothetical protein